MIYWRVWGWEDVGMWGCGERKVRVIGVCVDDMDDMDKDGRHGRNGQRWTTWTMRVG